MKTHHRSGFKAHTEYGILEVSRWREPELPALANFVDRLTKRITGSRCEGPPVVEYPPAALLKLGRLRHWSERMEELLSCMDEDLSSFNGVSGSCGNVEDGLTDWKDLYIRLGRGGIWLWEAWNRGDREKIEAEYNNHRTAWLEFKQKVDVTFSGIEEAFGQL